MSAIESPVSDMLTTVKTREVQRGMLAEMRGDKPAATRHLLAAAHLELVLADDYARGGQTNMSIRSRLSAASCLWRAGERAQGLSVFTALADEYPEQRANVQQMIEELAKNYPEAI